MSVNSSSSSSDSLLHPNISSIKPYILSSMYCFISRPGSLIYTTIFVINIVLLLPVCILVLYLCLQRCWKQRSVFTASSHSDTFIYHLVTVELFGIFGCTIFCCGIYWDHVTVLLLGYIIWSISWNGQMLFHLLTCVERYLAVVHPITYLSLRRERGIRIRNISIGCVWLLSFGGMSLLPFQTVSFVVDFCLLIFSLIIISFCSLSVLCVLIHPGPGEQEGGRVRVNQSKLRAFYNIMATLGVLLSNFFYTVIMTVIERVIGNIDCVLEVSEIWFSLFSSLVLPLLFIQRAGKLACFKNNTNEDKNLNHFNLNK